MRDTRIDVQGAQAEGELIAEGQKKLDSVTEGVVTMTNDLDVRLALKAEFERQGLKPRRWKDLLFDVDGKDVN